MKGSSKRPLSAVLIIGGITLLIEHLFTYGRFDLLDFWGHEYLGIGMIIIGFLISIKWSQWHEFKLWRLINWWR